MFACVTFVFYCFVGLFDRIFTRFLDGSARISLQTLLQNPECLLHFVDFKNIGDSRMILSLTWCLVE